MGKCKTNNFRIPNLYLCILFLWVCVRYSSEINFGRFKLYIEIDCEKTNLIRTKFRYSVRDKLQNNYYFQWAIHNNSKTYFETLKERIAK